MKKGIVLSLILLLASCEVVKRIPEFNPNSTEEEASEIDGRYKTFNNMGWIVNDVDEISLEFLGDIENNSTVLEIGAGYGYISQKALEKGAMVYVNDLEKEHLEVFKSKLPSQYRNQVYYKVGKFPSDFNIPQNSLDGVLAQRVLHFLTPEEMDQGLKIIFSLLKKGGKLYITNNSPYMKPWTGLVAEYELRKDAGQRYPGFFEDLSKYNPERAKSVESHINLTDLEILSDRVKEAGFYVEEAFYLNNSTKYFNEIRLDGREAVGIVATKPADTKK